tara:strand:- start:1449 stop:2258 length:810 start_codon:yes stop_codon:yes gene_type:complete
MRKTVGVIVIASNGYFPLGIRFIKRFDNFYRGDHAIKYFFFSNTSPYSCISKDMARRVKHMPVIHESWVDSTNSKFSGIKSINEVPEWRDIDYIYYFDADTNISNPFTDWFIGDDLVGGEHFHSRKWTQEGPGSFPFERNEESQCFIPEDTNRFLMYYYGAFFGGERNKVFDFCDTLIERQKKDKELGIEPIFNDESYINHYFHYNMPKIIYTENFPFLVSCKGGIECFGTPEKGWLRDPNINIDSLIKTLERNKNETIDVANGKIVVG